MCAKKMRKCSALLLLPYSEHNIVPYTIRSALKNVVIWCKVHFWELIGSGEIIQNVKKLVCFFLKIWPKNFYENWWLWFFKMETLTNIELHTSIKVFHKRHKNIGKDYIIRHFWPSFGLCRQPLAIFGHFYHYWYLGLFLAIFWLFLPLSLLF